MVQIAEPVSAGDFVFEKAPHSKQGYVGLCNNRADEFPVLKGNSKRRIATLRAHKYREVIPDDRCAKPNQASSGFESLTISGRVDTPFRDRKGKVVAVVPAEPDGWQGRREGMERTNQRLLKRMKGRRIPHNRRGNFASYRAGFSYGGGQMVSNEKKSAEEARCANFSNRRPAPLRVRRWRRRP